MKIVIPSMYLGRTIQTWVCYNRIPFWLDSRSYVLRLDVGESYVPVPFLRIARRKIAASHSGG